MISNFIYVIEMTNYDLYQWYISQEQEFGINIEWRKGNDFILFTVSYIFGCREEDRSN